MENFTGCYKSSKTTEFLINLNKFVFIFGLPNFWVEKLDFSDTFRKVVGQLNKYGNWSIFGLILAEYGATYTTVITAYPDVDDRSALSHIVRVIAYLIWCIYLTRIFAVYSLVISLTIAMSYQFKNLTSYFYNLRKIFEEDERMTQTEKEQEYERAFRVGIKIHSETLKCTEDIQAICRDVFSGQIIFNILMLIVLMHQMVNSARNLTNAVTLVMAALTILLSTGFFMWNAGDITVEAQLLPTAMFSSGWENCGRDSSVRVRKLIVIAMMQAQEPVVLTGLGIIALSYQSYVSIVKSSYSAFSVLY
ncbi:hypothetical protein B5X24_HaOG200944 [Helicoverpa armigera]|nr:hypothetical protein B5X24_HaOG200944 [Helicoverpa armigera]